MLPAEAMFLHIVAQDDGWSDSGILFPIIRADSLGTWRCREHTAAACVWAHWLWAFLRMERD
ncbi:hypothetical protein BVH03_04505 [Pseudomonas sp. PA15(2017)]|nr:hypothetical protein BVH03_04505 [Pseudomonas sp. PA15(2017)]